MDIDPNCKNKNKNIGHCIVCYLVGAECYKLDLYKIIHGPSFDEEPLKID